jgi:CheY-like chemotaxis protein
LIGSKSKFPGQHNGGSGSAEPAVHERSVHRRKGGKRPVIAHILLVDSDLASRLTLSTLLTAGGYAVDSAASTSEAIDHIDNHEYQLVLADLRAESEDAGQRILAYARQKCYHPATALVTSSVSNEPKTTTPSQEHQIAVENEDVSKMLDRVAELIGLRVSRRVNRRMANVRSRL